MCGIIGYIGDKDISSVLLVGLERLSYRGYDSAGIAVLSDKELFHWKKPGKIQDLSNYLKPLNISGQAGIGHTRWATHGKANEINAHPHLDGDMQIAIVHNGIIENHAILKEALIEENVIIRSDTDSEIIAHYISLFMKKGLNFEDAFIQTAQKLEGSFAIVAICEQEPDKILAIKKDSPLILGLGKNEFFLASDVNAIAHHTQEMIYMQDMHLAVINQQALIQKDLDKNIIPNQVEKISATLSENSKGTHEYFMHKEIYEQPGIIRNILSTYLKESSINFSSIFKDEVFDYESINRFVIQACGTSWHAGLIAKYFLESYARIPTEVDFSSEMRYRQLINGHKDVVIAISQSGETADTLACLRTAKIHGFPILSFVNTKESSIYRESNAVIETLSGPEIGVASTKNYLAQLICLYLFSLHIGEQRKVIDAETLAIKIAELRSLPNKIEKILSQEAAIIEMAKKFSDVSKFIFVGRNLNYPTALEAALKLKEISYIHATGYPAGELKHGPIALVDEHLPVLCIAPKNSASYTKMLSSIEEILARNGNVILLTTEGNTDFDHFSKIEKLFIPNFDDQDLSPMLSIIPLQLLSYHIALNKGCNVDQPRNLAKSVTVE